MELIQLPLELVVIIASYLDLVEDDISYNYIQKYMYDPIIHFLDLYQLEKHDAYLGYLLAVKYPKIYRDLIAIKEKSWYSFIFFLSYEVRLREWKLKINRDTSLDQIGSDDILYKYEAMTARDFPKIYSGMFSLKPNWQKLYYFLFNMYRSFQDEGWSYINDGNSIILIK
jgi:hypothetical protein